MGRSEGSFPEQWLIIEPLSTADRNRPYSRYTPSRDADVVRRANKFKNLPMQGYILRKLVVGQLQLISTLFKIWKYNKRYIGTGLQLARLFEAG